MKSPPRWTEAQFASASKEARALFRTERLGEPLAHWQKHFDSATEEFKRLFVELGIDTGTGLKRADIARLYEEKLGDALRYLAGPPISEDDLKLLADTSLAPGPIGKDPKAAARILAVIEQAVDPRRFPWLAEGRAPTAREKNAALVASATVRAAQLMSTERRMKGKEGQEGKVKRLFSKMGLKEVAARTINTLKDAPEIGEFCSESSVVGRKADVVVSLFDGRLMPIECKVSNSSTNSVKRLNNDAAVKAVKWRSDLGTAQVVPAAVLSGVFKVRNLVQAQEMNLTVFWAHDLEKLWNFIRSTKE